MTKQPIEMWKQYQTERDGLAVRILAIDAKLTIPVCPYSVIALVTGKYGAESVGTYTSHGCQSVNTPSPVDLVEVPQRFKMERWVNVNRDCKGGLYMSGDYPSSKLANDAALPSRVACVLVPIEGREGEGLGK